jgi:hypothetical protein
MKTSSLVTTGRETTRVPVDGAGVAAVGFGDGDDDGVDDGVDDGFGDDELLPEHAARKNASARASTARNPPRKTTTSARAVGL